MWSVIAGFYLLQKQKQVFLAVANELDSELVEKMLLRSLREFWTVYCQYLSVSKFKQFKFLVVSFNTVPQTEFEVMVSCWMQNLASQLIKLAMFPTLTLALVTNHSENDHKTNWIHLNIKSCLNPNKSHFTLSFHRPKIQATRVCSNLQVTQKKCARHLVSTKARSCKKSPH